LKTEATAPSKRRCLITGRRSINPGRIKRQKNCDSLKSREHQPVRNAWGSNTVDHSDDSKNASTLNWNHSRILVKCLE